MNLRKLLSDSLMAEWSDEEIKKLNSKRLHSEAKEWDTSSVKIKGAGDGASNLRTILTQTSYTPGAVALADGIGLVIIEPDGERMRTETGRVLSISGVELKSTDREFFPLYSPGIIVESESWKVFIRSLCDSSVEERRAFYSGDDFTRRDMPYMYHSSYGRPVVVTSNAGSNNYYDPNDVWALFVTPEGHKRIGIKDSAIGKSPDGNSPPYARYDAFRCLNDEEIEAFSKNPWVVSYFERFK